MKILIIAITIIFIVYLMAFVNSIFTIFLEKKYNKILKSVKIDNYKNIYVLLPALKEQSIADDTIDWFSKIKYNGKINFIIITTEREENEYAKKNIKDLTTQTVVKNKLNKLKDKRFLHMHYPLVDGNKSSQMNYAIDYIIKKEKDFDNTYISVFDFDSKPDLKTFNILNKVAELRNSPDVIQQVPLAFKNYEKLSQENKVLEVLCSLQHSVRSFGVEKIKLLLSSLTSMKIPQYCMGACLHIKLRTLLLNNKFPFFVDDLTLGYRLSIKGCNFAYLPTYNYSLSQNKVADYVNSQVLIFKGVSTYLNEVYRTKGYFYGKVKMFISGTGNLSMFVLIPFLVIIYYLYMLFTWNITLLGVMLFTTHYLWSISSYIHIKLNGFKNDKKSISFLAIILSPIWQIFRPSGYIVFLKRFIISKITKSNIKYRKTER